MQCVSDLTKLYEALRRRNVRLRSRWLDVPSLPYSQQRELKAYLTIELDNLIVTAFRQFVKSSLLGARTTAGNRVSSDVKPGSPDAAAALVLSVLNAGKFAKMNNPASIAGRDEPNSRSPADARKVLTSFNASNLPSLQYAMGFNGFVWGEISKARHFFAHRSGHTEAEARKLSNEIGLTQFVDCETLISSKRPGSPVTIFEQWTYEVEFFFQAALS